MVTRPRRRARARLYIREWLDYRGLSVADAADKLGVARNTVNRYILEQHRVTVVKMAELAIILGIEPEELWRPPGQISIDAMVADRDDDVRKMATNIVRQLLRDTSK